MQRQSELADKFYNELLTGNRTTYIYTIDNEFVGEISLVKEMNDSDYTIPNQRIYVSRLIVKYEYRRQGIGRKLIDFITEKAKSQDYTEMSIGVDLDNSRIRESGKVKKLKTAENRALTAEKREYDIHPKGERKALKKQPFLV